MADQQAPTGDPEREGAPDGPSAEFGTPPSETPPSSWAAVLESVGLRRGSLDSGAGTQNPAQSQVPVLHRAGPPGSSSTSSQVVPQPSAPPPGHAREVRPDFTYLPYGAGAAPWSGSGEEWQPGPLDPAAPPDGSTASRRPWLVVALVLILVLLLLGIGLAVWRILAGLGEGESQSQGSSEPFASSGEPGSELVSALKAEGFTCSQVSVQPTVETCFAGGGPVSEPLRQYAWRVSIQTDESDVVLRIDGSSESDAGGAIVEQGWMTIIDAAAATVFADDPDAFKAAVATDGPTEFGDWSGGLLYDTASVHSFSFRRSELTPGFTPGPPLRATAADIKARALAWGFSCPPTNSGVSCSRTSRNGRFQIDSYTYRGETKNATLSASTPFGGQINMYAAQLFFIRATATMLGSDVATNWLQGRLDGGVYSVVLNGYLLELNPSNYGAGRNFQLTITGFAW
jgi:hypothetical protein